MAKPHTNKELLIRIDERQQELKKKLSKIEADLIPQSEHEELMEAMKYLRVENQKRKDWQQDMDTRIKVLLGIGTVVWAIIGFIVGLVTWFIANVLNK